MLLVEDETKLANAIKKSLNLEQFACDWLDNTAEALSFVLTEEYDLIILDWMFDTGNDGLWLLKELRQQNISIPVIFLTAKNLLDDKILALNSGADDYLAKPFEIAELLARVKSVLRRRSNISKNIVISNNLKIDQNNLSVNFGKKVIDLSPKSYSILEYLVLNKDKVITKEKLISHLWDYDADILPNTVEVHINYLRKQLKRFGLDGRIKTIRGFGYKYDAQNK